MAIVAHLLCRRLPLGSPSPAAASTPRPSTAPNPPPRSRPPCRAPNPHLPSYRRPLLFSVVLATRSTFGLLPSLTVGGLALVRPLIRPWALHKLERLHGLDAFPANPSFCSACHLFDIWPAALLLPASPSLGPT